MKLEAPAWIAVSAVCVSILVAIFNKWWDDPIAAHVGYPFGVPHRVEDLGVKVGTLRAMQIDLRDEDPFPSSAERIRWLKSVDDLLNMDKEIKNKLNGWGRISYFRRCIIGKQTDRELNKANDLISQGGRLLPEIKARPRPVRHVQSQELRDPLPGMEVSYEKVLHFIKDNNAQSVLLGIWGMGGVGKTTLISLVRDSRSKYQDDFVEVLFVHAGKRCTTIADLQKAIAISIALPQIGNQASQANIIHNHLQDKSFLLLVDDLWEDLDLDKVGFPSLDVVKPQRRKVVFTTRSMNVCSKMGCRRPEDTIQMKCLSKQDAWNLFAQKVGDQVLAEEEIKELAKKIAEECSGLPMALCKIGKIVSALKDPREWRTTRDLLKKSKLHQLTGSNEDLFRHLQESYDNMTRVMQERFLLCSLWPENDNISVKTLIMWWTGLGLLDGFSNASDSGYTAIEDLVRASMLERGETGLDSTENSHVKMHNMIRMMAIWIVNEHGYKNKLLPNSSHRVALAEEKWLTVEKAWVSQQDTSRWCQWSSTVRLPELKMLVAQHEFSLHLIIRFFQNITFLDLEGTKTDRFPLEICELIELQHLNLSATTFHVLPEEVKMLSKLKNLYIRNNMGLKTIPKGLLLKLQSLQVLDLFCTGDSFSRVQYTSPLLEELTSPTEDLHMLGFTVQTIAEIKKLRQLNRVCTQALCMHHFEDESDLAIIDLQLLYGLQELRELSIKASCHSQKVLVAEGSPHHDQRLLPCLEIFELNNLLKLEKVVWKNAGMGIRVVSIYKCDKIRDMKWVCYLRRLEELTVAHCNDIEILIETEESLQGVGMNRTTPVVFRQLKKLKLDELPKLSMICKQACEFEVLSYIRVIRCNEVKDIQNQVYKQSNVKIDCSEDWWNRNSSGRFIPRLVPTFVC